jgi:hypothetical protein
MVFIMSQDTGIGIYGGLFLSNLITHSFDLFIYIIGAIVIQLVTFSLDALQTVISLSTDSLCLEKAVALLSPDITNSSNTPNQNSPVTPERIYEDAAACKEQILKENKGKSGVYR